MTEIQQINANAKSAFDKRDYPLAFQILWKNKISDFISYAQKEEKGKKCNWLAHADSGDLFWNKFILDDNVFDAIFNSDSAEQLLYNYFSKANFYSKELESRLTKKYPEKFIKAIRCNQSFLQPERIENLCVLNLSAEFSLHQRIWKKLYDEDQIIWKNIQKELDKLSSYSLNDILTFCVIWLETIRFKNDSNNITHNIARTYSFFIELTLTKYPEKCLEKNNSDEFFRNFLKTFERNFSDKKNVEDSNISILFSQISQWIDFKENILSPYCYDLNINPIQENELVLFNSRPDVNYRWILNGVRYDINQLNYHFQGIAFVEQLESDGLMKIPGKTQNDTELNRNLAQLQWGTIFLLHDIGIDTFQIGESQIETEQLISPLLAYSFNRLNRYENKLKYYSNYFENWNEAFLKLTMDSIINDVCNEPYVFLSQKEYIKINSEAVNDLSASVSESIINLFSKKFSANHDFNRFKPHYDVWQKPFIQIGDYLFCPMVFFASNIWFYSFAQEGLTLYKTKGKERGETKLMESYFAETIRTKGWKVHLITDQEANNIKGDIDIFVEDKDTLLFIQLKRTYFRLDLKDAYYESINTDNKAAKQLNEAETFLTQNNSIYNVTKKPVKWIVSTSFENIGSIINGCRKINYFEFLNALKNPEVNTLKNLIDDLELDKNIKAFVDCEYNEELPKEMRQIFAEILKPLKSFESKKYRQIIFSDDEAKTNEYFSLFEEAIEHDSAGRKNEAIDLLNKCISIKPDDGEAYGAIANIFADIKLYEKSLCAFEKALDLIPNDPYVSRNFCIALLEAGKYYKGLQVALKLFEDYPLYGDNKVLFEKHFEIFIKHGLLNTKQIVELQDKWDKMN